MIARLSNIMIVSAMAFFCSFAVAAETKNVVLESEVREAETLFAKTMADRDLEAFASFLDEETVFSTGDDELRGKDAVLGTWSRFFGEGDAPFSWESEYVAVLDSGELALSSGPVFDPQGNRVGTFNSVWRKDKTKGWKIIFDRGCP